VVRFLGFVPAGFADVYDIETEEVHQFYADGILVHNSWRYGLKSFLAPRRTAPVEVRAAEVWQKVPDAHNRAMAMGKFWATANKAKSRPSWRSNATI
jgi:hypothetical protein